MTQETGTSAGKATGGLPLLLAFTPLIFVRKRIGVRLLSRDRLLGASVALFCGPQLVSYVVYRQWLYPAPLIVLALLQLALGFYHRSKHYEDLERGASWSTYDLGVSHLQGLIRVEQWHWIPRFVDPFAVFLFGWIVSEVISQSLGWWLMLCAVCFFFLNHRAWQDYFQRNLDTHDNIAAARQHAEAAEHYAARRPAPDQNDDGEGIPTGKGPDVTMNGRRPRRPEPPDNLA